MLSVLDILLLVLSSAPASASPVRRWLNTSSSEASLPSSAPVSLPLNTTTPIEHAAADAAYNTASDDCEDMSNTAVPAPTWPAALNSIRPSDNTANAAYSDAQATPPQTQAYRGASRPDAYASSTSSPAVLSTTVEAPQPYTVTSLGKHANATSPAATGGYGAAEPYGSSSVPGTTTLTLYTTVGLNHGGPSSASSTVAESYPSASLSASATADRGLSAYGGQTTSMAAYTNTGGYESKTSPQQHPNSKTPPKPYGSQSALAYSSVETSSSSPAEESTRTRHRPHRPTIPAYTAPSSQAQQYTSTTDHYGSQDPTGYPGADTTSSSTPADTDTVTVNPVPTSYSPPSQAYSYSPQTTTSTTHSPPDEPPVLPTSRAYSHSPDSSATDSPALPTVVTESASSATETTISSSATSMAGITIVPYDPDATTVYVTVTTTDAGVTTTVAGPTVTAYA